MSQGTGVTPCSTDFTTISHQKIKANFRPCYIRSQLSLSQTFERSALALPAKRVAVLKATLTEQQNEWLRV